MRQSNAAFTIGLRIGAPCYESLNLTHNTCFDYVSSGLTENMLLLYTSVFESNETALIVLIV